MNAATLNLPNKRHLLLRMRFQLLGGLTFAILIPVLVRTAFDHDVIFSSHTQTTIFFAFIAHTTGYLSYRRIAKFPGVAAAGYILPTFALSYGLVFLTIFFFRIEYSRYQAASSFIQSILWYFVLNLATRRLDPYQLAIIPGGDVDRLESIQGVIWHWIHSPETICENVSGVVADLRSDLSDDWTRYIADRALSGTPVYHIKQISESLTGRVDIEHLSENTLGSLNPNHAYLKIKYVIDWSSALLIIVVLLPVLALVAFIVKLESEGPALFCQKRVGYRGEVYTVYKFRTMRLHHSEGDEKETAITKHGDERITRIGRYLRKFRIDELPQLFNIIRGEMSWIGPRPEVTVLSKWYEAELPFYRYRHIVRPGISGWAQVNQGHVAAVADVLEKLHYDFYYIKNFSPWLDVLILLRTVKTILTGFGAR